VRAAIRDASQEGFIRNTESVKDVQPGSRLQFVVVPDITTDEAYDQAVKDVQYIIHLASGVPGVSDDYEKTILAPAVRGTSGILQSAHKTPGIRRIVITGSGTSIVPTMDIIAGNDQITVDENMTAEPLPPPYGNPFVAYATSKILAFKATQDFIEREKPAFDVITILPSYILGKNELITDPEKITVGSNGLVSASILGHDSFPAVGHTIHVNDVARVHVLALDAKVPGNTNYIVSSGGLDGIAWADALKIVADNYPDAVAAGILPNNKAKTTLPFKIDARKADGVFHLKYIGFEDQVKSITDHYLDLVGAKAA
jgi:nucleoside-diphosphate-sugar epimerase